jgi:hypothetical protein
MSLDQAAWHTATKLPVPRNLTLLPSPASKPSTLHLVPSSDVIRNR